VWSKAVDNMGTSRYKDMHDNVLHAIIAHHAWREWGSPCTPDTRLAWLLHLCDSLSARLNDCLLSKTGEVAK
jgi:23S rRNA maturation-related 3'-5' exoribonuclease YhaM